MSIDDPTEPQSGSYKCHREAQHHEHSTWQQPKQFATFASQCSNVSEKDEQANKVEEKKTDEAPIESSSLSSSIPTTQPARRLSVQDRFNPFENKQKENSSSSGSGGKPIVSKSLEFRRLLPDASVGSTVLAAEKSVLQRWSGASEMSIDVTGERKDTESSLCTPSSGSSVSRAKSNAAASVASGGKEHKNIRGCSSNTDLESGPRKFVDIGLKDHADSHALAGVLVSKEEASSNATFAGRAERVVKIDQRSSQETTEVSAFGEERTGGYKDRVDSEAKSNGFSDPAEVVGAKYLVASQIPAGDVTTPAEDITSDVIVSGRRDDRVMRKCTVTQSHSRGSYSHARSCSGQFEGSFGLKFKEGPSSQVEVDQAGEYEEVMMNSSFSSKQQVKAEDSDIVKRRNQKPHSSGYERISKSGIKRDDTQVTCENSKFNLPSKELLESQGSFHVASIRPTEQFQRPRQSKGNRALNDELKMKADELEKLFAEHQQRVPGDQYGSARRIEPTDTRQSVNAKDRGPGALESTPKLPFINAMLEPSGSCSNVVNFGGKAPVNMVENHDYGDAIRLNFLDLNFGDNSRGKFYGRYVQKRDAKLREEWSSKRLEKEAKMKAMQDNLDRSRAEMKAKFIRSIDREVSVSAAQRRTEKLRSFNLSKKKEQQPVQPLRNEEDEDISELSEEKIYGPYRLFSESPFEDCASRQNGKILPYRNVCTSTAHSATVSKVSNSSGRRRDNHLAQSVPNFSDLKKETTRPSSGVNKIANRSQVRNYAHSRSTNEEVSGTKEEKKKQFCSLQKSSAGPAQLKDFSSFNSDGIVLEPLKFDRVQTDLGPYDHSPRSFLKKGNNTCPGVGTNAVMMKASLAFKTQNTGELDEPVLEGEDSVDMAREEDDETETMVVEDCAHTSNGMVRLNLESAKSGNSGSEIGDSTRSLAQVDPITAAEMPTAIPSAFNNIGSLQDSPVESPISWNSHSRHSFAYSHEPSDVDVSVGSPIGSPSSWNSSSIISGENDTARMRRKWESAQGPILVGNSSYIQSRNDVTNGFKRLLKFGRRNPGPESLVDWVSATTSEGDDYTEDVQEPASGLSEDLRKSRTGFSHGHPSKDSFNENELFSEKVQSMQSSTPPPPAHFKLRDDYISGSSLKAPRSFFSFSSFRSKGSDTKPR